MGYALALIMFVVFMSLNTTMAYFAHNRIAPSSVSASTAAAQNFINYKNAVANYATANPAFTGTVSSASLSPYLNGLSSSFLANVSNSITVAGTNKTIMTYAQNLASGTTATVLNLTSNDASIGYTNASGAWSSYSSVNVTGLTLTVLNNNLVSVITTN